MQWFKRRGKKKIEATIPGQEPQPAFFHELMPEMEQEEAEAQPQDFMEIDDSPVPGLTLLRVLQGHKGTINSIAWSPDGRLLASPSADQTIRLWDVATGECVRILQDGQSPEGVGFVDPPFSLAIQCHRSIEVLGGEEFARTWHRESAYEVDYEFYCAATDPSRNLLAFSGHYLGYGDESGGVDDEIYDYASLFEASTGKIPLVYSA